MPDALPKVFIGSSSEHKVYAEAIQASLADVADGTVWHQGVVRPGDFTVEALERQVVRSDYGVFVFAPDDVTRSRGVQTSSPRDNVVFECGLFLGRLGRERCYVVSDREAKLKVPSDLYGVTHLHYRTPEDKNWLAALGPACNAIKTEILDRGCRLSAGGAVSGSALDELVHGALKTVCRAVSLPKDPKAAGLRAFIFRHAERMLVCRHFWVHSDRNTTEHKDSTRFSLRGRDRKLAVVRAWTSRDVVFEEVIPAEQKELAKTHFVSDAIRCVLATPIFCGPADEGWGIVDIDSSTRYGVKLLKTQEAQVTLKRLAEHLGRLLTLDHPKA